MLVISSGTITGSITVQGRQNCGGIFLFGVGVLLAD